MKINQNELCGQIFFIAVFMLTGISTYAAGSYAGYGAAFFNIELPKDIKPTHQERAYTSPIWYTPS